MEITGQKSEGVLVLPVLFIYQKRSTPSWTTNTHPLIAALEKWRVPTQQATCDTTYRKLTQQIDVFLEGLVNDSLQLHTTPAPKNNPISINHNTKQHSQIAITKVPVLSGFWNDVNRSWKHPPITNLNHWIYLKNRLAVFLKTSLTQKLFQWNRGRRWVLRTWLHQ
jgi:hypothetical protein